MTFGPFVPSFGPRPARIAFVGEAPGQSESEQLRPLVGASGHELRRMLNTVGVNLDECFKTNVFSRQPANNDVSNFGVPRERASVEAIDLGPLTSSPQLYLAPEWEHELARLREELTICNPNIIVALGNIACWALLGRQGINEIRGTLYSSPIIGRPVKVIPTYHPAAVLRQWDWRVVSIADFGKALANADTPYFEYDSIDVWLEPTLDDLATFRERYLVGATHVATDVETQRGQITCISFAPSRDVSICIPFWASLNGPHYWTEDEEIAAWRWVFDIIEDPSIVKVMQNGLYDVQYMIKHGMKPRACTADTMLAHHSLYSEMRKGLGFLGSCYANVPAWKNMRTFRKEEYLKRDD